MEELVRRYINNGWKRKLAVLIMVVSIVSMVIVLTKM